MMAAVVVAVVELQQMVLTELLLPVELKLQLLREVREVLPAVAPVELVVRQVQVLLPAELHLYTVAAAAELQVIIQVAPQEVQVQLALVLSLTHSVQRLLLPVFLLLLPVQAVVLSLP
jgi:hypothetical protein